MKTLFVGIGTRELIVLAVALVLLIGVILVMRRARDQVAVSGLLVSTVGVIVAFVQDVLLGIILFGTGLLVYAIRAPLPQDPRSDRVPCRFCAEDIKPEAVRCPYCRSDVSSSVADEWPSFAPRRKDES